MKLVIQFILLFLIHSYCYSQDSAVQTNQPQRDSVNIHHSTSVSSILDSNKFIAFHKSANRMIVREMKKQSKEFLFYILLVLFFLFGILKIAYSRYLSTMVRVFFNTSLRQSQLTDQLLQSKLPSLFFNLFYFIIAGFYIYLILGFYRYIKVVSDYPYYLIMAAAIALISVAKYLVVKFTGWISNYNKEADMYIFIVFLVNKILSIFLLPVIFIVAFAEATIVKPVLLISYFVIALLFIIRYIKSYALLENKLNIKRFHFVLYIVAVEVIPLFLIYKIAERFLTNYL